MQYLTVMVFFFGDEIGGCLVEIFSLVIAHFMDQKSGRSRPRPHANTKCSCCGKIEAVGWTLNTISEDISKQDAKDNICILNGGSDRKLQNVT